MKARELAVAQNDSSRKIATSPIFLFLGVMGLLSTIYDRAMSASTYDPSSTSARKGPSQGS